MTAELLDWARDVVAHQSTLTMEFSALFSMFEHEAHKDKLDVSVDDLVELVDLVLDDELSTDY
jgi:hypothetical protein